MLNPWLRMLVVSGVVAVGVTACGDEGGGGSAKAPGRGTEACRDWQDAFCDFASDECGFVTRADCDAQYQGVECKSDAVASACSNAANEATCTKPIEPSCDVAGVADPAPAIAKCEDYLDAICAWQVMCDPSSTMEECLDDASMRVDCSRVVVAKLSYETCMSEIEKLACTATKLPSVCDGVVLGK